jgi:hypothetical protein
LKDSDPHDKDTVEKYENIFEACKSPSNNVIKLKIVQELIQIVRPKNWNSEKVKQIIKDLYLTERYNAIKYKNELKFYKSWSKFEYILK